MGIREVEIRPLTVERWADFEKLFGPRGAYAGCWCMWPRLRSKDFNATNAGLRKEAMRGLADSDEPPGLVAYVDGDVVGWVALDRRERLEHFEYSRKVKALDRPDGLWSIVCFVIDKEHRRQGLMSRLLEAAVDYARERGARVVEAYPVDPRGELKSYHGFTGIASVFERAGFVRVGGTEGDQVVRVRRGGVTVRIGIIGSRFVANLHALAVRQVPGAELIAAASPNAEHAWAFHRQYEIPHVFQDYKDMLDSGFVDAVTVACPNDLHCEVTMAAAKASKHVFVDKPLALSLAECDRMIEACATAGVQLMYGENLCFAPKYVRAKELADEGALGEVYYVRQLECHYGPHSEWFWDVMRSGGGVLMDMGCHSIAFCRWAFGNSSIESVNAEIGTFVHSDRTRGDDHSLVTMRFAPSEAPAGRHGRGGELLGARRRAGRPGGDLGSAGITVADIARGSALNTYSGPGYQYAGRRRRGRAAGRGHRSMMPGITGSPKRSRTSSRASRQGKRPVLTERTDARCSR